MNFVSDELSDGRKVRALTVIDLFSRECLAVEVSASFSGRRVAAVLERLLFQRGAPKSITVDNCLEPRSRCLDAWAHQHRVQLDFIQPGKPVQNAHIQSSYGRLREGCLSQHWFESLEDARRTVAGDPILLQAIWTRWRMLAACLPKPADRRETEPDFHFLTGSKTGAGSTVDGTILVRGLRDGLDGALETPHARRFRRTFEDLGRAAGIDQLVRKSISGWRSDGAQAIYATVSSKERKAAGEAVVEVVFAGEWDPGVGPGPERKKPG